MITKNSFQSVLKQAQKHQNCLISDQIATHIAHTVEYHFIYLTLQHIEECLRIGAQLVAVCAILRRDNVAITLNYRDTVAASRTRILKHLSSVVHIRVLNLDPIIAVDCIKNVALLVGLQHRKLIRI